jgi:integrase/recombinase XerC
MDRLVRARVLLAEAEALGLTLEDLVIASAGSPLPMSSAPTLAEYVETVAPSFGEGTAGTYRSYWRLAVARFGDRPVDSIDADDCGVVLVDAVRRAQQRRPGSDGRSSRENCIAALRALFGRAERAGLITKNPARELDKPRRRASRRRALDDAELAEAIDAVRTTSQDPDLDLLLVRFHLESGARREGALNLRLGDLDSRRSTVLLREKFGLEREQPIPPSLLAALDAHAQSRGAARNQDPVFRTKRDRPITRRRYNTLFDGAQAALPWTARTPVTAHALRHTAGTAIERIAGYSVAGAFFGHAPSTVTGIYSRARLDEVAAAVAALTGEPHPLAARSGGAR